MTSVGMMASSVMSSFVGKILDEPFNNFTAAPWVTTGTPSIVTGRSGTAAKMAGNFTDAAKFTIPAAQESDTVTVGFAFRIAGLGSETEILHLNSDAGATNHLMLKVNSTGQLILYRSTAGLTPVSPAGTIVANTWAYVEVQAKLHDTAGAFTIRVNGTVVATASNVDTKNAGTKTVFDTVRLFGQWFDGFYDDLYVGVGGFAFQGDPHPNLHADNFDRANTTAPGLGSPWTDHGNAFFISSNRANKINGDHYCSFNPNLGAADHWVEADISGIGTAGGNYVVIYARAVDATAGSRANLYDAFIAPDGIPHIGKNVGNAFSDVATGSNVGIADCKLRLEVQGSAQRLYRNGVLVATGADTSIAAGNFVGINSFAGNTSVFYDNFRCGPLPYTP